MLRSVILALKIRPPHRASSGHRLEPMPRIRWYS